MVRLTRFGPAWGVTCDRCSYGAVSTARTPIPALLTLISHRIRCTRRTR